MLLAGDVGGTKTLLGLFEPGDPRPVARAIHRFTTLDHDGLGSIVAELLGMVGASGEITSACFGVAGPVRGRVARLTNVPWAIDADHLGELFAIPNVALLNDVAAMGYAVPVLTDDQLAVLQRGEPVPSGNRALIAPGTGLGEALLHNLGDRYVPSPTEAGHADFAARTPRELALATELTARHGRVSYEDVVSGPGLVHIHEFVHKDTVCPAVSLETPRDERPAAISAAALDRRCEQCVEVMDLFVSALGAEAGNLGLRSVATAGVYLGGGIPAKILPALKQPAFLTAFRAKTPMDALVAAMPVKVILDGDAALLGAAVRANQATNL